MGQTSSDEKLKAFRFVDSLFREGDLVFQINDVVFPPKLQEILSKIQKSMAENKEWFEQYFSKNYKEGEGLPYNEKLGVTKEEYEQVQNIRKNPPKLTPIAEDTIAVAKKNWVLTFKSKTSLKTLDPLRIDLNTRTVMLGSDTIPYAKEIDAPVTTLFGKWHGYSWKYERSNQTNNFKFNQLEGELIEINFGKTIDNKGIISLKVQKVVNGTSQTNAEIRGFIK
jgi:hypothetical protein